MWPDNETDVDLLNVRHLVTGVADTVTNPELLPVTIGVFGGWGQGKSSLIRMIQQRLADNDDVLCVTFNGWLFESYDDAKSALMETILESIRAERTTSGKAKDLIRRLSDRIDWFRAMSLAGKGALTVGLAGADGGVSAASFLSGLSSTLETPGEEDEGADRAMDPTQTVRGFREDFIDLLDETEIDTLVVFIDELDRCLPNAVVETLEAIRLFLFVERTAFVIGADEDLVEQAVSQRFRHEGREGSFATRYLEKMIQIPFRIPPMGEQEIETYMNLLFTKLLTDEEDFRELVSQLHDRTSGDLGRISYSYEDADDLLEDCPAELGERFVLTGQLAEVLCHQFAGNPRQVKRFMNMLLLRLKLASLRDVELKMGVLGKLMLLEYFHRQRFRELAEWQNRQKGKPEELRKLEETVAERERSTTSATEAASDDRNEEEPESDAEAIEMPLTDQASAWLTDEGLTDWLQRPPRLQSEDLRPYFYIAREQTGPLSEPAIQLSPDAEEALRQLRSQAEGVRRAGASAATDLAPGEATAVFSSLVADARRAEELGRTDHPPMASIFELVEQRGDLASELVSFLRSVPPIRFASSPGVVPRTGDVLQGSPAEEQTEDLLRFWSTQDDVAPELATAADLHLEKLL